MKTQHIPRAGLFLIGIFILTIQSAQPADNGTFTQLRLATSRVPGWTEQKERYRAFTAEELYNIIDGGAVEHQQQGLKKGIGCFYVNGNQTLDIYFEDFGTFSRAKGMVEIKGKSSSNPQLIPQAKASPAIYDAVISGCIAYWAQGRFYIEMTLTGYDSLTFAVSDARMLIDTLSPVIGK